MSHGTRARVAAAVDSRGDGTVHGSVRVRTGRCALSFSGRARGGGAPVDGAIAGWQIGHSGSWGALTISHPFGNKMAIALNPDTGGRVSLSVRWTVGGLPVRN